MTTALTIFDQAPLPAHIAAAFSENENILERMSTNALTFRGKTWRMRLGGEETVLTKQLDGESVPVPAVQVIVLNLNQKRSRVMYGGAFEEGKNASPVCWSSDGEAPDTDVKTPFAKTCAACPNSVKGSKVTANNKETTACSPVKRVAVIPAAKLDMAPMLLKIPQTSIWDKNNPTAEAEGYYAWDQYVDFLRQRNVKHTAAVVTKIKFDANVAYPKLLFSAVRWLEAAEIDAVRPLVDSEDVKKLITGKISEGDAEHPVQTAAPTPIDNDDDGFSTAVAPAPSPAPAPAAKPAAKPPKAAAPKLTPVPAAAPSAAPAPVAAVPAGTSNAELASLAAAWDD